MIRKQKENGTGVYFTLKPGIKFSVEELAAVFSFFESGAIDAIEIWPELEFSASYGYFTKKPQLVLYSSAEIPRLTVWLSYTKWDENARDISITRDELMRE